MTQLTAPPTPSYSSPPPARRPINWRVLTVLAVVAVLVGYPVFTFVKAQMNGGVEQVADGYKVDLKALGYFPFDQDKGTVANVPQKWRDLDGKKVTLEGFCVFPDTAAGGVTRFQFVYNVGKCCYGGPPLVQERVFGFVPGGMSIPDQDTIVQLTGVLHVNVQRDSAGKVESIYTLDVKGGKAI